MFKNNNQPSGRASYKAFGMAIGLIVGGLVGLAVGNLIVFSGGCMVLGLAIGTALDGKRK